MGGGRRGADRNGGSARGTEPRAAVVERPATVVRANSAGADWEALVPQFLAYCAARNSQKYCVEVARGLDRWRSFLEEERGIGDLASVRGADVAAFAPWRRSHTYRGAQVGIAACNRDLAALKALFAWATRLDLLAANPCVAVPMAREHQNVERIVVVETPDFERTLRHLSPLFADAAVALLGTGMRWGSLAALTSADFDPARHAIKLRRPKGKVGLELVVSARAFEAARRVAGKLSRDVSGFNGAVGDACERARVPRWTAHHLRHTFACHVLRQGADPRQVQAWLGHASLRTTERYLHLVGNKAPPAPI